MKRRSFCEWMPMLPWPMWPLAEHARLGQNTVVGSMTILLSWLCWGACQEKVCLDPRFLCNLTPPRFSVELPNEMNHRGRAFPLHIGGPLHRSIHRQEDSTIPVVFKSSPASLNRIIFTMVWRIIDQYNT